MVSKARNAVLQVAGPGVRTGKVADPVLCHYAISRTTVDGPYQDTAMPPSVRIVLRIGTVISDPKIEI